MPTARAPASSVEPHGARHNAKEEAITAKKNQQQTNSTERRPAKRKKIVSLAEYEADKRAGEPSTATTADVGAGSKKSAKADKPTKTRKTSGLDAVTQVLAEAGGPMGTKQRSSECSPVACGRLGGKTPAATIHSALLRHIQKNGANNRFRKVDRGRFELVK